MSQVNTLGNPPRESPVGKCGQCTWYEGNMMRDYAYCLIVKHKVKSGSGGCHHWEANV